MKKISPTLSIIIFFFLAYKTYEGKFLKEQGIETTASQKLQEVERDMENIRTSLLAKSWEGELRTFKRNSWSGFKTLELNQCIEENEVRLAFIKEGYQINSLSYFCKDKVTFGVIKVGVSIPFQN